MADNYIISGDMKIFLHHIYELQKGVRNMVLCTIHKKDEDFAVQRLQKLAIEYCIQPINELHLNVFFGKKECIDIVRLMIDRPLNLLTPEEDFIIGALLGYDICQQCGRYYRRKSVLKTA